MILVPLHGTYEHTVYQDISKMVAQWEIHPEFKHDSLKLKLGSKKIMDSTVVEIFGKP